MSVRSCTWSGCLEWKKPKKKKKKSKPRPHCWNACSPSSLHKTTKWVSAGRVCLRYVAGDERGKKPQKKQHFFVFRSDYASDAPIAVRGQRRREREWEKAGPLWSKHRDSINKVIPNLPDSVLVHPRSLPTRRLASRRNPPHPPISSSAGRSSRSSSPLSASIRLRCAAR